MSYLFNSFLKYQHNGEPDYYEGYFPYDKILTNMKEDYFDSIILSSIHWSLLW